MNEVKNAGAAKTSGILYIVAAVLSLLGMLIYPYNRSIWVFLEAAVYIYLAVVFLLERRDFLPPIGFGVLTILTLRSLFVSYGFGYKLAALALVIGYAAITLFGLTDYIPSLKDTAKKFWFLPACCVVAALVLQELMLIVNLFRGLYFFVFFTTFFSNIIVFLLMAGGLYFAAIWLENLDKAPFASAAARPQAKQTGPRVVSSAPTYTPPSSTPERTYSTTGGCMADSAYCDLIKHVLLLLFTFGIWNLIWIYRTTDHLNCLEDEMPRNPATKLLLCMFVPFYSIYWVYKSAQRLDRLSAPWKLPADSSGAYLIMAIFTGFVPCILMQDRMNTIVYLQNGGSVPQPALRPAPQPSASQSGVDAADELKKYKELLDMGAITQEEFDRKKQQLLGL